MSIISKKISGFIFISGLLIILALNLIINQPILTSLSLVLGLIIIATFLNNPKWGLFLILLLRPSIDKFSEKITLDILANFKLNVAALFGLMAIFLLSFFIIKNKQYFKKIPLKKSWFLFLTISTISIFWSVEKSFSLYETIRLLSIFLIFCSFFILTKKEKNPFIIVYAIICSSVLPFLTATYQIITKSGLGGTSGIESRVFGTFSHPNPFASFALIVLVVTIFLIYSKNNKINKWLLYSLFFWGLLILIETFSRGAWLAFLVFIFLINLFKSPKNIIAIGVISFILFLSSSMIQDRIKDVYNPPADSSVRWRFAQWNRMFAIFQKDPLRGQGIGTEIIVHETEYGFYAGNPYTHNDFLRVVVETGIFGFMIYFLLISLALLTLFKDYKKSQGTPWENYKLFIFALFLAMTTFSLTNNTLRETVTQWLIWGLIGSSLALSNKKEN